MTSLALTANELNILQDLVGSTTLSEISLKDYFSAWECDKYDCFFRGVQCPCEGICDGKQ